MKKEQILSKECLNCLQHFFKCKFQNLKKNAICPSLIVEFEFPKRHGNSCFVSAIWASSKCVWIRRNGKFWQMTFHYEYETVWDSFTISVPFMFVVLSLFIVHEIYCFCIKIIELVFLSFVVNIVDSLFCGSEIWERMWWFLSGYFKIEVN